MSWKGHVNILDADLASLPSCAFSAAALLTPRLPHLSHNCTAFPVTIRCILTRHPWEISVLMTQKHLEIVTGTEQLQHPGAKASKWESHQDCPEM